MANEDDLLACLLDVAEAELNSLNRKENGIVDPPAKEVIPSNRKVKLLKDIDLFSRDSEDEKPNDNVGNAGKNQSSVHEGYTDSSDDEASRNLEDKRYSESGQSLKNLIDYSLSSAGRMSRCKESKSKNTSSSSWNTKSKGKLQTATDKSSVGSSGASSLDTMFGIRVINPVISSSNLEDKMVGRKVVSIQHISNHLKGLSKDDDWVIAGVICNKGTVRTSAKGHQFIIWTVSDLLGEIKTVALFLFGSAYEQFWKTQAGSVVGVLNPSILDKKEGSRDEAALSIDNAQKLLILGQSKDFGTCKSTKKNGDKCTAIVNKKDCEFCVYHVKKEYQKCSRRSELQANFSGKGLIALRNKVLGKNEVFYAGKSYTAIPAKQSRKLIKKDKDRLQSLSGTATTSCIKKPVIRKAAASFDVDRSQRLKDMDTLKKLGLDTEKGDSVQSTLNLQKNHSSEVTLDEAKANALKVLSKLKNKTGNETVIKSKTEKENNKSSYSLSKSKNDEKLDDKSSKSAVIDNKYELLQKSLDEIVQTDFIDLDIDYKKSRDIYEYSTPSIPKNIGNGHKEQTSDVHSKKLHVNQKNIEKLTNGVSPSLTSSSSAKTKSSIRGLDLEDESASSNVQKSTSVPSSSQSTVQPVFSQTLLKSTFPSLSNSGGVVDLSKPLPKRASKAKLSALKYIEKNGPIEKSNPNSVKGKGVKRSLDELNVSSEQTNKLQKIQGNEHLSDRFKKMMELQSKHMDLVELRDNEEKEKYFKKQEVKERMEEKMANTYKIECKAVRCLDCKYTSFSAADKCKAEKHRLVVRDAMKRFFKCGNCGNRTVSLDIIPLHPCKNCGDGRWERTTMMKEKNFTNTVSLSIRGGEQKFTNSVVTDANINLLVPDES